MIARDSGLIWVPQAEERDWDFFTTGRRHDNPSGVRVTPETALESTVVLACIRVLAESVASLPLHVYRRLEGGGKEVATTHPLYRVLHTSPNRWQTSFEWREQAMLHLCLYGNSFHEIKSGERGAVTELIPLHPSRMSVERIENGRLRYRYTEAGGHQTVYTQDRVMHLRWLSDDGVNGMVPVELARDAIGLAKACEIHGARYFGGGARPGVVLETDQVLDQAAASAIRDNWERMHLGPYKAYRTAILMGGLKAHEMGSTLAEAEFLALRAHQVAEICRIFRMPPHLVADLSKSSFSNIEQSSLDFLQHTLLPWLRRFESALDRDIVTDGDLFVEFDTRGLLRGDVAARASYYQTLWNLGVASINELRDWENLNPIENGDHRFVQLNMSTLGQTVAASERAEAEAKLPPEAMQDPETPVAQSSMNGQQIAGLISILEQYSTGLLDTSATKAMIQAAFPTVEEGFIDDLIDGTKVKGPGEEPPAPPTLQAPAVDVEEPVANLPPTRPEEASDPEARNCGTGAGGFKSGNKCAGKGKGGGGGAGDADQKAPKKGKGSAAGEADQPAAKKAATKKTSAKKTSSEPEAAPKKDGHHTLSKEAQIREDHAAARKVSDYPIANKNGDDTMSQHTTPDGKWTPERAALHKEIIEDAIRGVPPSEKPVLNMMGGGPAAGKSSIEKSGDLVLPEKRVMANPDEFKADLPEYRAGVKAGDTEAAGRAHEESSYLNKEVMKTAAANKLDTVWDGTGDSSVEKVKAQTDMFRAQGFAIKAHYVTVDTETAVDRAMARGVKTGRIVPERDIRTTHAKVSQIWPEAVKRGCFDESAIWDTSAGGKPLKIASAKGTKITVHNRKAYKRFLAKATEDVTKVKYPEYLPKEGKQAPAGPNESAATSRSMPEVEDRNCGTGSGGFKGGNKCAGKGGSAGVGSVDEAQARLAAHVKDGGVVSLRGMDAATAHKVADEVDAYFRAHPASPQLAGIEAKKFTGSRATGDPDATAAYNMMSERLLLNTAVMGSEKKFAAHAKRADEAREIVRKAVEDGTLTGEKRELALRHLERSLVNDTLSGAVIHELGHHFDATVLMKSHKALRAELLTDWQPRAAKLSAYASKSAFEYFAEAFTAHRGGVEVDPRLAEVFGGAASG